MINGERFLAELSDYAKRSDIYSFFSTHTDFYKECVQKVKEILVRNDYVKDIEDYYGLKQRSYNIILSPLFEGNYGPRIKNGDGYDLYAIIGEGKAEAVYEEDMIRYLIWHEFSHSFINPLSDEASNKSYLNGFEANFETIKERMKKQGYTSWITTINEHVIRAVTVRLTYIKHGEAQADKLMSEEKEKGFLYVSELCKSLSTMKIIGISTGQSRSFTLN